VKPLVNRDGSVSEVGNLGSIFSGGGVFSTSLPGDYWGGFCVAD
jgi:hypothetical protein